MPEDAAARREVTLAGEIYARYRGAADRSAARPRPLDAPVPLRRRHMPLVMETLAWHYLHSRSEAFRQACLDSGWTPHNWKRRLLAGDGLEWLIPPEGKPETLVWGPRSLRRWGRMIENGLRQMRPFPASARLCSQKDNLANLEGWYLCKKARTPGPKTLCIRDSEFRLVGAENLTIAELSPLEGNPEVRQRFAAIHDNLYLPVCTRGRIHLPRPLLALTGQDPAQVLLWNTPAAGQDPSPWPVLGRVAVNREGCPCGLTSWTMILDSQKQNALLQFINKASH